MRKTNIANALSSCVAVLILYGCAPNGSVCIGISCLPDFTPEKPLATPGPVGFCKDFVDADGDTFLEVRVKNLGAGPAAANVEIRYPHSNTDEEGMTVAIPGGEVRTVGVKVTPPIPTGGFNFTIVVDPGNEVDERSEDNNEALGRCIT